MFGRLIIIFLGLALFINSCNNLLSQWAGTYRLRTLDVNSALKEGIGEADYIQLQHVCPGSELFIWESDRKWVDGIAYFHLNPCTQEAVNSTQISDFQYVGWAYLPKDSVGMFYPAIPEGPLDVEGLVRRPPRPSRATVFQHINGDEDRTVFLRLDAKPTFWGWFVAGMLLPALLIFWIENRSFKKKKTNERTD